LKDASLIVCPRLEVEFPDPVRRASLEDLLFLKIPRGLRFNDRVSMAHSRELRVPFLDHRFVEFSVGLPTHLLITSAGGKTLFREVLKNQAPSRVAYAPKRSMQSPQREWLAIQWRGLVESLLLSDRFADRGWVDPHLARKAYSDYIGGRRSNSFFIWQWVNLELWARMFLDGEKYPSRLSINGDHRTLV